MGKVVERKMKKKKGRPSLLDLQKRSLKEQQKQPPLINPNPILTGSTNLIHPSTSRNSTDDGGEDLYSNHRDKKLKVVLKFPSSLNSASPNSSSYGSDSNPEEDAVATNHDQIKLDTISDGSARSDTEKVEKQASAAHFTSTLQGTGFEMGPSTPLPDEKLLLFILDRLQKKDTYGVFAEPVDPNELPDYHEIIEHPMDFATVRMKLGTGTYPDLEQFEKDVFLICSNAMQYNAPDTIYYRQARSIQELAKKNFENLRQGSDDNKSERKILKRGRPPTKHLQKPLERTGSEFSSDANGGENNPWSKSDARRRPLSNKFDLTNFSGRRVLGSRNGEAYSNLLPGQKFDDDCTGLMSKGKWEKKQVLFDGSRRNSYKQAQTCTGAQEPSPLAIFHVERKQLISVGLHTEFGYARSLARFAAKFGPVAWKIASQKIEKSLPHGVKYGLGWVGETEYSSLPGNPVSEPMPTTHSPLVSSSNSTVIGNMSAISESAEKSHKNLMSSGGGGMDVGPENPAGIHLVHPLPANRLNTEERNWGGSRPPIPEHDDGQLSPQQKQEAVPPDLNVKFQSPTSPREHSLHPDLALQL